MNWFTNPAVRNFPWLAASFLLSLILTALAIRYARHNNMVDVPGQRRSHSVPTPRGGGFGIVACVLLGLVALSWWLPVATLPWRFMGSIALLAAIGWIDDHRPLAAWLRMLVQLVAVGIWLLPLIDFALAPPTASGELPEDMAFETAGLVLLFAFLTLWSINLHNFMDGIDGLLATQAIFVLGALALLERRETGSMHPLQLGMWAAAIAGFLPFNFPRARVFMGDVGSGVIGLLVAVAVVWQTSMPQLAAASGFIAASAFVVDATCTLLSRMLSGRRWYRPHREHLYQWLTRTGMSHARVVTLYMGWNVLLVAPVLWWINRLPAAQMGRPVSPDAGYAWALGIYVLGVALWICGKRWCLRRVAAGAARTGLLHAPA